MKKISPSMILSIIALIVSMSGASYAATRYIITSVGQIKPHVRAELRGERGPAGLQGPRGSQGPQGATGTQGPQGQPGITTRAFNWSGAENVASDSATLTTSRPNAAVEAFCPHGFIAITGGFSGYNEVVTNSTSNSNPPPTGWNVFAHLEAGQSNGQIQAWVECVQAS